MLGSWSDVVICANGELSALVLLSCSIPDIAYADADADAYLMLRGFIFLPFLPRGTLHLRQVSIGG